MHQLSARVMHEFEKGTSEKYSWIAAAIFPSLMEPSYLFFAPEPT